MKKILVTILLFTYAFAASGASVELHYCMGKLIGVDFDHASKNDCRNCGMKTKPGGGCCNTKQIQVNVDQDQQAAYNNIHLSNDHFAVISVYSIADDTLANVNNNVAFPSIHAPPFINRVPVYLLNCNFRI
jgi:hypothetical protein